ncbi:MAG: protein kinase, partial [Acidobacteriota bacterium]|nr:protein kinase [Acidobacteriota bacterium]
MGEKGIAARLSKLGRYEVLSELGKGAMGIVYLAKDPVIGRMVAIKTIRASSMGDDDSESREFRERFVREAQTAGILSHPHIVTIHDIGEDPDTQTSFIAMEYIEGKNLKSLLNERANFSYDQVAEMIAQVAEAIDYAHRKGIIHRDIKPANIIITTDEKVKITDFGIAKVASSNLTTTGQFLGTPNYMSPEQVSGAPVDGRSDIFSLGVVLYELLTHRKPFVGENLTAISYKIVHEDFTPPAELSSEVPTEFNPIVARAMAKDPWNRYQRGKDFALALHQLRAHLEEQRALQDLGTIVSQAEFMPTLRLANMDQLVLEEQARQNGADPNAPPPRTTEVVPPLRNSEATQALRTQPESPAATLASATASGRATAPDRRATPDAGLAPAPYDAAQAPVPATPMPEGPGPVPAIEAGAGAATVAAASSAEPTRRSSGRAAKKAGPAAPAATPPPPPPQKVRVVPLDSSRGKKPPVWSTWGPKVAELQSRLKTQDWKKLSKSEVNPLWVWRVIGGVVLFFAIIVGGLFVRKAMVSRPTAAVDPVLAGETKERKRTLETAKKLFTDGRYDESLALSRKVLARSPNNDEARKYAQMAENALTGKEEAKKKGEDADKAMGEAQAAFAAGKYEDARKKADDALALDGGRVEAQQLREQAAAKIAEADTAA